MWFLVLYIFARLFWRARETLVKQSLDLRQCLFFQRATWIQMITPLQFIILILIIFKLSWNYRQTHSPAAYMRRWTGSAIVSGNGLAPSRWQAITWTKSVLLSIGPFETNFSRNWIEILTFSFKKVGWKTSSIKWRSFCPGGWVNTFFSGVANRQTNLLTSKIMESNGGPEYTPQAQPKKSAKSVNMFFIMLLTDIQTNKRQWKHNFCSG